MSSSRYIECELYPGIRGKVRKLFLSELLLAEQSSAAELPGYLMSMLNLPFWQKRRLARLPVRVLCIVLQNILRTQYATLADEPVCGDWRKRKKFTGGRYFYDICQELAIADERRRQRDKYELYFAALLSMIDRALGGNLSAADALLDLGDNAGAKSAEPLSAADAVAALGAAMGAVVVDNRPEAFRSGRF